MTDLCRAVCVCMCVCVCVCVCVCAYVHTCADSVHHHLSSLIMLCTCSLSLSRCLSLTVVLTRGSRPPEVSQDELKVSWSDEQERTVRKQLVKHQPRHLWWFKSRMVYHGTITSPGAVGLSTFCHLVCWLAKKLASCSCFRSRVAENHNFLILLFHNKSVGMTKWHRTFIVKGLKELMADSRIISRQGDCLSVSVVRDTPWSNKQPNILNIIIIIIIITCECEVEQTSWSVLLCLSCRPSVCLHGVVAS